MTQLSREQLGRTDMEITRVGLGSWAIGGSGWGFGWGAQDDKDSVGTIDRAIERGINWIYTAAIYGYGHSEDVIGRALAHILPRGPALRVHEMRDRAQRCRSDGGQYSVRKARLHSQGRR